MSTSSGGKQGGGRASLTLCPVIQHFLPFLALQELRPGLAHAVYHHLDSCASCAEELEQYEAVTRLLRERWKGRTEDTADCQFSGNASSDTLYRPDDPLDRIPSLDDTVLGKAYDRMTPPSPSDSYPSDTSGALAFARKQNEAFRLAFDEALAGGPHLSAHALPSDVFATGVRRSLARIAQQWDDPENQPCSEEHKPC